MRHIALTVLAGIGLTACGGTTSRVDWSSDCQKHHSYDAREFDICMKKVASGVTFNETSGKVFLDPYNVSRPSEEELNKDHGSDN